MEQFEGLDYFSATARQAIVADLNQNEDMIYLVSLHLMGESMI